MQQCEATWGTEDELQYHFLVDYEPQNDGSVDIRDVVFVGLTEWWLSDGKQGYDLSLDDTMPQVRWDKCEFLEESLIEQCKEHYEKHLEELKDLEIERRIDESRL